jgi:hypothetical protein
MMPGREILKFLLIAGALGLASAPAFSDAIDGDWCAPADGRHVRIAGPSITTPTGRQTTGDYSRHAFSYVIPEGDPEAGETVYMRLLNDEEVSVSDAGSSPEIWHRCEVNA